MSDFIKRWSSTKLATAFTAMSLILVGFLKCQDRNAAFGVFVGGILTSAGLLKTANLIEKLGGPKAPPAPPAA